MLLLLLLLLVLLVAVMVVVVVVTSEFLKPKLRGKTKQLIEWRKHMNMLHILPTTIQGLGILSGKLFIQSGVGPKRSPWRTGTIDRVDSIRFRYCLAALM